MTFTERYQGQYANRFETCPWCGSETNAIRVGGHEQCGKCHRVIRDCCDGEVATQGVTPSHSAFY